MNKIGGDDFHGCPISIDALKKDLSNDNKIDGFEEINQDRRNFISAIGQGCFYACSIYALFKIVSYMDIAQDQKALGTIEVDISKIQPGEGVKLSWRGKPVFIVNRTEEQIKESKAVNLSDLKDPQLDEKRTKPGHENMLVIVGICTHLGCVPTGTAKGEVRGDFNGWFCPCHGSHYDLSGRIRKGPAPRNLEVPPYKFVSDKKILIGDDDDVGSSPDPTTKSEHLLM